MEVWHSGNFIDIEIGQEVTVARSSSGCYKEDRK